MSLAIFIVWLLGLVLIGSIAWAAASLAPWVPTHSKDLERIMQLFALQPGQILYDLGCGDGKVVLYGSRRYALQGIGIELALPFYYICQLRGWLSRTTNCSFRFGDLFNQDLSNANGVYIFGMPKKLQQRLVTKLKTELKPGTRVVSCAFQIKGLTPVLVNKPSEQDLALYLYQF